MYYTFVSNLSFNDLGPLLSCGSMTPTHGKIEERNEESGQNLAWNILNNTEYIKDDSSEILKKIKKGIISCFEGLKNSYR